MPHNELNWQFLSNALSTKGIPETKWSWWEAKQRLSIEDLHPQKVASAIIEAHPKRGGVTLLPVRRDAPSNVKLALAKWMWDRDGDVMEFRTREETPQFGFENAEAHIQELASIFPKDSGVALETLAE